MPQERFYTDDGRLGNGRCCVIDRRTNEVVFEAPRFMGLDSATELVDAVCMDINNTVDVDHTSFGATDADDLQAEREFMMSSDLDGALGTFADPVEYAHGHRGGRCPECGSDAISAGKTLVAENNIIGMEVECLTCGSTWVDVYVLDRYENLERG